MPDCDGYPTEEELKKVVGWDGTLREWFAYIKSIGKWWGLEDPWGWDEYAGRDDDGKPTRVYLISTGGWSGNEEILGTMRENWANWSRTWMEHRRGGHYRFEVREEWK